MDHAGPRLGEISEKTASIDVGSATSDVGNQDSASAPVRPDVASPRSPNQHQNVNFQLNNSAPSDDTPQKAFHHELTSSLTIPPDQIDDDWLQSWTASNDQGHDNAIQTPREWITTRFSTPRSVGFTM